MSDCTNITLSGLENINACENNLSGVKTLYLCPVSHVTAINAVRAASITSVEEFVTIGSASLADLAIECATGKGFVKVFSAKDMGELKYASQGELAGCRSFKATLEIFNPGFKRKVLGLLSYLNNEEVIIVAKMNNGEYHLLGDLDRGAILASGSEMTSGKAATDNNGANPTFEYDCAAASIFWEGFDPTSATNGIPILTTAAAAGDGE